jgi:hypothetical protein
MSRDRKLAIVLSWVVWGLTALVLVMDGHPLQVAGLAGVGVSMTMLATR